VLFDVAAFILATVFFITKANPNYTDSITLALVYSSIVLATLLFAMKKRYPRDVIDPINGGLK